ncbi:MAG: formylglycine-generating enzyme family protein [Planctomycetota bacterium]|nr:formylglycine-generating enzyme family protein [Planctomycetota bacterium]
MHRTLACLFLACALACGAEAQPQATFPLWDGKESIEHYAKRVNLPPTKALDLGNGVNLDFVLIPAGKFVMGTPEPKPVDEDGFHRKIVVGQTAFAVGVGVLLVLIGTVIIRAIRKRHRPQYSLARFMAMIVVAGVAVLGGMHWWQSSRALALAQNAYKATAFYYAHSSRSERPAHRVTLTRPFFLGKYEVTQEQYEQVAGTSRNRFEGPRHPVDSVEWADAQQFCEKLAEKTGHAVRLPTEAEWEYACRAGTRTAYYTGDSEADMERAGWCKANSGGTTHPVGETHPVGQKTPNAWGVYDMHGNVCEYCQDIWWGVEYNPGDVVDPKGFDDPRQNPLHVLRGGSWLDIPDHCRSSCNVCLILDSFSGRFGLRVVVEVPKTP